MIPRNLPGNFYDPTKNLDVSSYFFFGFSKIDFALEKVKERNILHVVDLSFDTRFAKYF